MTADISPKIYDLIKKMFPRYKGALDRTTTAANVPGWDSFSHVQLMFAIEDTFAIDIDPGETFRLQNVGELIDLVSSKVVR